MRRFLPVLLAVSGCASAPSPPKASAPITIGSAATAPVASSGPVTPLSLNRLLRESKSEMQDMNALTEPLSDPKGRARAEAEVSVLADELRDVEAALRDSHAESEPLDEIATKLTLLQTRIAILHDRLRVATLPSTAVQNE